MFMAYVHTSVNKSSRSYLANERRYNYTTPKSFLEQIKLYQNLLSLKSKDLATKMERLENGLQKLNSTSSQVGHLCLSLQYRNHPFCLFLCRIRSTSCVYLYHHCPMKNTNLQDYINSGT